MQTLFTTLLFSDKIILIVTREMILMSEKNRKLFIRIVSCFLAVLMILSVFASVLFN